MAVDRVDLEIFGARQEARELARDNGDKGMTFICQIVLWLQILVFLLVLLAIFR